MSSSPLLCDFPPLCDGIAIVEMGDWEDTPTIKMFTLDEINANIPDDCYEQYDPEDSEDSNSPLGFLCSESALGTSISVPMAIPGVFGHTPHQIDEWFRYLREYNWSWDEKDELVTHLKHLMQLESNSKERPLRPVSVRIV